MSQEHLFSGIFCIDGGLTNDDMGYLSEKSPTGFGDSSNEWTKYAFKVIIEGGASIENWEWKSDDELIKQKQLKYFRAICLSPRECSQRHWAIAGWMLSEMLINVPEYIARK